MKKGISAIIILVLTCLMFLTVGVLTAADMPDTVTINTEGYKKDIKGPVDFSHMKHATEYGAECTACHHEYEDGKNIWDADVPVKKCIDCHDPNENQGNAKKLMLAYHNNCRDCHKEVNKEGKNAPDKSCDDCHAK